MEMFISAMNIERAKLQELNLLDLTILASEYGISAHGLDSYDLAKKIIFKKYERELSRL